MNASTYKIFYTYIFWFFIYLFINSLITRNNCENDNFFYISLVKMFTRLSHLNCNIKWNCSEPPARKHMIQLNIVYFCYLFFTHFYSSSQSFGVGSFSFFILFFVIFCIRSVLFWCIIFCDQIIVVLVECLSEWGSQSRNKMILVIL